MTEIWRDIPGYGGLYQASSEGRIRRLMPSGERRVVKIVPDRGTSRKQYVVNMYVNGRRYQRTVLRLVALAFYREKVDGMMVAHRNGLHADNSLRNVQLLTPTEIGNRYAGHRRRAVCQLDSTGQVVEIYPTMREACEVTGLAKQTIMRHCNHKKTRMLPNGISFAWDKGVT